MSEQKDLLGKPKNDLDPVDIHDEISAGFSRIENVIREEMAKISEHLYEVIHNSEKGYVTPGEIINTLPPIRTGFDPIPDDYEWPSYIPEACRSCSNHPSNGGSGICHCTLGSTDCSWK